MLLLFLAVLIPYLHIDLKFQALHRSCVVGATTQKEVRDKLGWFHESRVAPATNLWGRGVPPGGWVCQYKHAVTRESFQVYYDAMGRVHGLVPTYE